MLISHFQMSMPSSLWVVNSESPLGHNTKAKKRYICTGSNKCVLLHPAFSYTTVLSPDNADLFYGFYLF